MALPKDNYTLELEERFMPSKWVQRTSTATVVAEHVEFVTKESDRVKATIPCELGVPYGPSAGQKLDLFGFDCLDKDAGIFIYIHGGYWQEMSREVSSYCVEPLIEAGIAVVIMGYDLAPTVSMDEIPKQIERGVRYVVQLAEERKSKGIYIGGHSAGAHLAAMLLHTELLIEKLSLIKGFILISGVYDLRRLIATSVNEVLKLDVESAERVSPLLHVKSIPKSVLKNIHFFVTVGKIESPEFVMQTCYYAEELKNVGALNVTHSVISLMDHFNIVELLCKPDSIITQSMLEFIMQCK